MSSATDTAWVDDTPPTPAPSTVFAGRMPDITAAQVVGLVGAVFSVAVSFGVDISKEQQEAILALAAAVAAILFAADAHVRTHRVRADATRHASDQHLAAVRHAVESHREVAKEALAKGQPPPDLVYPPPPPLPER